MNEFSFLFTGGIGVLALIVTFYSVVSGTQRIPNFLISIYTLIKYALIFLFCVVLFLFLYVILKDKLGLTNECVFYIQGIFFMIVISSLSYFLLKEYHKVFSMRCYFHATENITSLFYKHKKRTEEEPIYLIDKQMECFCDKFLPKQKKRALKLFNRRTSDSISAYCEIKNRMDLDDKLIAMAKWALHQDTNLVYLSCRRHPYEFFELLKKELMEKKEWMNIKKQILLIDAHTNHFGFKEPTYFRKTNALESENIIIEVANWSYVGIHSAIAHGYEQKLKIKERKNKASLLIYDSCYALTDLENEKLYRIFLKHVVPSERCMGGNITIFAEQWVPKNIKHFIDITVDFRIE